MKKSQKKENNTQNGIFFLKVSHPTFFITSLVSDFSIGNIDY